MSSTRIERDSFGPMAVPCNRLWGAQTQRSMAHFAISCEAMPRELLRALAQVKGAAAAVNARLGLLDPAKAAAISQAAIEVQSGRHDQEFPLLVWQTGSGTQTHMNMNEVLANRASQLLGGPVGGARLVHAHDEVNLGQSTNDVFPTAMNVAAVGAIESALLPALAGLQATLQAKATDCAGIVKIGRTHLQDATPLTLGQAISAWVSQLAHARQHVESSLPHLRELAIGGTAVGTGLNTHAEFGQRMAEALSEACGTALVCAPSRFEAMAAHDALVNAHGTLRGLAAALTKIANDVRWLASGPRAGLGEIRIPENEPGSSIMPGKVNPTQCEALAMACCQVMGNDVAVGLAGASGAFELNVYKPLIAHNVLQSVRLLADSMRSFDTHCASGIEPDVDRINALLEQSLMLVTALSPHIGYDKSAQIARLAHEQRSTLREAAIASGHLSAEDFDAWVRPEEMVHPHGRESTRPAGHGTPARARAGARR